MPALPALRRLVALDPQDFADRIWAREPLLSRADELPQPFADLLDADAVDELVASRALRTPFVRMAKDGGTLPERTFTTGGGIGAGVADQLSDDKVLRQLAAGATLVLQALHRTWPPVLAFSQQLAADLGHPVQANAYVTPPQNQGFDDHYDVHDVFVLQVEGEKRWRIHAPVLDAPLRDQPWTDRRAAVAAAAAEEPLLDVVLRPGDCLYLPRGTLHAATALGGVTAHLTLGVHTWTRHALAEQLVRLALADLQDDADVRGSLRLGVAVDDATDVGPDVDAVRARLVEALGTVAPQRVAAGMGARVRDAQRAAPVRPLAQLRAASELDDGTKLALRPHLAARVLTGADGAPLLRYRAGSLPLVDAERVAVERLLTGDVLAVADLGADLARRLLLAGVALQQ